MKKYKKFCKENLVKYDFDIRPYSTIVELFRFRDSMAHGKSTVDSITKEVIIDPKHPNRFSAGPKWMEYATLKNANKAIQDVDKIITELHVAGGYSDNPFNDLGGGIFGVQRLET